MAISGDYATPVMVNGYSCKNCTDVDNADRHIDPNNTKAGPYGINDKTKTKPSQAPSVTFGGALSQLSASASSPVSSGSTAVSQSRSAASGFGSLLDVRA